MICETAPSFSKLNALSVQGAEESRVMDCITFILLCHNVQTFLQSLGGHCPLPNGRATKAQFLYLSSTTQAPHHCQKERKGNFKNFVQKTLS